MEENGEPLVKITPLAKPEMKQRILGLGAEKEYVFKSFLNQFVVGRTILESLIILSVLMITGCFSATNQTNQTATNSQPPPSADQTNPVVIESQPPPLSSPTKQNDIAQGYCSMANGCPTNKCRTVTQCLGGNDTGRGGDGCAPGETTCEYKDSILKEKYREVTAGQAKQCVQKFITKNLNAYPTLKYLEIEDKEFGREADFCMEDLVETRKLKKEDNYCWFVEMKHKTEPDFPFGSTFYVGAQTCTVYWKIPKVFKTNISALMRVNYSPAQAVKCAEKYIEANKTKFIEYQEFVPGTLSAPGGVLGPGNVTGYSKDLQFYIVTGQSRQGGIYLSVGAHSCTVYEVKEELYHKF